MLDLNSDQFIEREKATQELTALGELAESKVRRALSGQPFVEARRRLEHVLRELAKPSDRMRVMSLMARG